MSDSQILELPGFQVLQYLGSGARSTVWQIRDRRTDELFALKRVVRRESTDQRFLEQAINEYEAGIRFDHPVVRRIYRLRKIRRWLSVSEVQLVMELVQGQTVQDNRPEDIREIVRVFEEVAKGLAHINSRGYVHADMKPNNILVGPDGQVKIIDLGQSCPVGTVKKRIQGTPDFISPEQVNRRPLDARTDVFNCGAALYWTLTGKPIPTVMPKKSGMVLLSELAVVPPEQVNDKVPISLSKLVLDCVHMSPSHRPESMIDVQMRLNLIAHTLTLKGPGL